ncbi:type IV pilus assembly protein PilV [Desulfonatronum zhilinae]|nr:type IV pilus assembly protein PilV [Desulfonatronum zhilinae]
MFLKLKVEMQGHKKQKPIMGFSLVEVLVGLIILAIGLLGLAGLQMQGLRNNNSSYLRSQATILAYDIVDRMRANRSHARNGFYVIDIGEDPADISPALPTIVLNDLTDWKNAITGTLPGPGDGSVSIDGTIITIIVQWDDIREGTVQFQTQSEL